MAKRSILAVFSIFPIYFQYKIAENQFCRSVAPFLPLLILIFWFSEHSMYTEGVHSGTLGLDRNLIKTIL